MIALLKWHRKTHPDPYRLMPYINAGRQAWARFEAYRILEEIDDTP